MAAHPTATPADAPAATQTIFRFRREYNAWVADESMEDYALRYTPKGFRRWSEFRVANTAFGSLSFLALEAIGGAVALNYGFANAMWAILAVGVLIFLTGLPIAYCAARYGLDMDLLTRGAGFGYLGSTITSLIYAVFTFIFFALEAAIMALALQLVVDWPLQWCYVLSSLVILPLAMRGITLISRLQAWTQPLWLFLLLLPFVWIALAQPQLYRDFASLSGLKSGSSQFDPLMFGAACAVIFSLVVQIGEQVDFLRFLPERTAANRWRWWGAVLVAGPGWIAMGMLKMAGGAFLAFAALQFEVGVHRAAEPTQMFLAGFRQVMQSLGLPGMAVAVTVLFVVVSQIKINLTNAYAGSLAWSNFFARVTRSHPGRVVWLVFNVGIATLLMTLGVFGALEKVLAVYSNVAIAWVGALVADLVINKPLGLSPRGIEFRRAHLYDFNPVGLGAMVVAAAVACCAYAGLLGETAAAFSPFIALALSMALAPLFAWWTGGRYYLARPPATDWAPGKLVRCAVCENRFESEDMARCPAYGAAICSLCCSLESRCHDRCKTGSRAADQLRALATLLLPRAWAAKMNFRLGQYLMVFASLCAVIAFLVGVVYVQEGLETPAQFLRTPFLKVYALLALLAAVCAWWVVLSTGSRRMAQDESERQTQLLLQEIEAHKRTDAELQAARDRAEAANMAKTRYVAGMTHELRSPLNSILGYTQILQKAPPDAHALRDALSTIERSGRHMHALIDDSLELARIEAGRLRQALAPLPLPELVHDVEGMLRPQAEARGLAFAVEVLGTMPEWIRADARRLRQILINLLSNAVRFTREGEVRLRLDFRAHVARIEVIDTGIGIEPQDLERIFLPFERGSAGRRTSEPGTGLGLTITHLLTELMGGQLSVRSTVGEGSTFTARLYLPAVAPDPAWQPAQAALRPVVGYRPPRRTLLVVDDQPLQRQLLAGLLVPLGFDVREAASGRECLEIVRQSPPDLVLLDISMDDLDGWQTAALLRECLPAEALPIVFVSANQFDNDGARVAANGCQGFVGKPVVESELLQALQSALGLQWLHDPAPQEVPPATGALPAHAGAAAASAEPRPEPLPEPLREALHHLARSGQASALRARLRAARADHPGHAVLAQLQDAADQMDFDRLTRLLREPEDDDNDEPA
ncbi:hybrid sensor histidine kinase/response regulator [Paracidovorax avenae]|uniref:hybrid sensor histidine kinase/response regulator n=1 Tax=Paracidovorax avenae TaxID=80867 RepID=UPI000D17236C|nr:ATP-binding protein [Paracidovorax avenae]AVS79801.1 hybrid sensor histidine kinase/response regulator [Paracidovorax avenae]AVT14889.1 hybrid sensor histidine kinase/response regulator [Paracidovorax avenae]